MENQEIQWSYGGSSESVPSGEVKTVGKTTQLAYLEAFEITEKTPKAQLVTINGWNLMRQCLIDNGLMKQK